MAAVSFGSFKIARGSLTKGSMVFPLLPATRPLVLVLQSHGSWISSPFRPVHNMFSVRIVRMGFWLRR